jgi:uncharacterized phage-like protein YoqJ
MIIAGTGHRPQEIGGFKLPNPTYNKICQETERLLVELKPDKVLSGMALGFDQYLAAIAYKRKIPFVAVLPFEGQETAWPQESQKTYRLLRKVAIEEVIVSPGGYTPAKMQIRNQYLCDHSDILLACFIPTKTKGGTFNCIQYAKSIDRKIIFINPTT